MRWTLPALGLDHRIFEPDATDRWDLISPQISTSSRFQPLCVRAEVVRRSVCTSTLCFSFHSFSVAVPFPGPASHEGCEKRVRKAGNLFNSLSNEEYLNYVKLRHIETYDSYYNNLKVWFCYLSCIKVTFSGSLEYELFECVNTSILKDINYILLSPFWRRIFYFKNMEGLDEELDTMFCLLKNDVERVLAVREGRALR